MEGKMASDLDCCISCQGSDTEELAHCPVLLEEAIAGLAIKPQGIYVDATFGRGGHTKEILKFLGKTGKLMVIDRDQEALVVAHSLNDSRLIIRHGNFSRLGEWLTELGYETQVDGILMDLGVASPQLDKPQRGFSFLRTGPLDMRMDQTQTLTAATWLNSASEQEIAQVLYSYGEEKFSRRIARALIEARKIASIDTTTKLAEIITKAHPRWEVNKHPATRSFQAIRILVNDELNELVAGLTQAVDMLRVGGRLAVITFHSLEDRLVKNFVRSARMDAVPTELPLREPEFKRSLQSIAVVKPKPAEIKANLRARSAKLRVLEKLT